MNQDFVVNKPQKKERQPKIIKRYGNRKLYDTEQSSYVVLNDIAKMIKNNEEVRVIDNETKDDITNSTFTQIIFGAEKRAACSVPLDILKSIIMKGDGSLSNFLAELGLFTPVPNVSQATQSASASVEGSSPSAQKPTASLEERIVNAATVSSHDILEDGDLPKLPNANKNLADTTS
ncbi:MAG: polyhydroxyalkanoate synthesis regulator DNA-binding domain-containing protein [Bdellovibrionales bacterium]|nr:polyhydroxyalkanoate synthesis regulator DNA-binding domain-containing protein [Bdellovibrionales bacterium]